MNKIDLMKEARQLPLDDLRDLCVGLQEVFKRRVKEENPSKVEEACKALFDKYPDITYIPLISGGRFESVGLEMACNWQSVLAALEDHAEPHFLKGCLGGKEFSELDGFASEELDQELDHILSLASMGRSDADWDTYETGHGDISLMNRMLKTITIIY